VNTQTVRQEVVWAVLGMEAAVVLPIMALIAPGDGTARLLETLLLLLLLPAGYAATRYSKVLRDPAWRVLAGFALVVLLRLQAPLPDVEGAAGAMAKFLQALVPASLAFALWWRGGSFADRELVAADVHLEFLVGGCALVVLQVVCRGLVAVEPSLLVWSAGLFLVSGLVALALSRQDAAEASDAGSGRVLGAAVGVVPIGLTALLLLVLRPNVMVSLWTGLARLLELILRPLLLLLSWLASLLPTINPSFQLQPPPPPMPPAPDLEQLANQQQQPDWIPIVALTLVLLTVLFFAVAILRLLLKSEIVIQPRERRTAEDEEGVSVEGSGDVGQDARQLLGWLAAWVRGRLRRQTGGARGAAGLSSEDAWTAYRQLLRWAAQRGIQRTPAETTHQLQERIVEREPRAADVVDAVTATFEDERYGQQPAPTDRLRRVEQALRELFGSM
jgi:hypothetical protein